MIWTLPMSLRYWFEVLPALSLAGLPFVHPERVRMLELCCPYYIPHLNLTAWEPVNLALLTVYYGSDTTISYTICHSERHVLPSPHLIPNPPS